MNTENNYDLPIDEIRTLMKSISRLLKIKVCESNLDNEILCAEISLLCYSLSDEIEQEKLSHAEILKWHETAYALKRIASFAMNLTPSENTENDVQTVWDTNLGYISENADYICRILGFPFKVSDGVITEDIILSEAVQIPAVFGSSFKESPSVSIAVFTEDDGYRRILREIQALRDELAKLAAEKAFLENDERLRLSSAYAVSIGRLLSELYIAEVELNKIKRTLQLIQASLNRKERPEMQEIDKKLHQENAQFREKYEDFVRKEKEAREYQQKRAENEEYQRAWHEQHERQRHENADRDDSDNDPDFDLNSERKRENISDYMKKLYRKLVKALHPDLHPNQSPEHVEMFKRVTVAYANGDLQALETIWELLQNGSEVAAKEEEEPELKQLLREKLRLLTLIQNLRKEIAEITANFPFTMRDVLDNPEKLAAKQNEIRKKIDGTKAETVRFEAIVEELKKKL